MSMNKPENPSPFALQYQLRNNRRPYNRAQINKLPKERSGIYAIWLHTGDEQLPQCIYVGQSTECIRSRLLQHLANETNRKLSPIIHGLPNMLQVSFAYTSGYQETLDLETEMIRALKPETNLNKTQPT